MGMSCGTVYLDRVHHREPVQILPWNELTGSSSSTCLLSMGKAVVWKRRLCHVEKATLLAFLSSHTWENYPFHFEDGVGQAIIVTLHCYTVIIIEFVAPKLQPNRNLWFQQDGAMPHMTVINMAVFHHLFPQNFGDIPWPSYLLDLTALDFFCGVVWKVRCKVDAL